MMNSSYEELPMDAEEYSERRLVTIPDSTGISSGVPCPPKPGANPAAEFLATFGYLPGVPFSDDEDTWRYCPGCFALQLQHPDKPSLWSICAC